MQLENNDSFSISSISISWKITNFYQRATPADRCIKSPVFQFHEADWSISLYPNGDTRNSSHGKIGIYLKKESPITEKQEIYFDFAIVDCYGDRTFSFSRSYTFTEHNTSWGTHNLVQRNVMLCKKKQYLPSDTLTISCNISLDSKISRINAPETKEKVNKETATDFPMEAERWKTDSLCEDFEALYKNSLLADVTLKVGNRDFLAHKAVLSIRSKVFKAMLETDMKESRDNAIDLVEMEEQTVQDMLCFVYSGKIGDLTPLQALNLFVAADRYDLQELKTMCRSIVLENLSVENFPEVVIVADLHNDQFLIDAGKQFLRKNMKEVMKAEKWNVFAKESPAFYLKLIESVVLSE